MPTSLHSTFTLFCLLSSSISLSYFILAASMHKCLGKHCCTSSTFSIANTLNAVDFFHSIGIDFVLVGECYNNKYFTFYIYLLSWLMPQYYYYAIWNNNVIFYVSRFSIAFWHNCRGGSKGFDPTSPSSATPQWLFHFAKYWQVLLPIWTCDPCCHGHCTALSTGKQLIQVLLPIWTCDPCCHRHCTALSTGKQYKHPFL